MPISIDTRRVQKKEASRRYRLKHPDRVKNTKYKRRDADKKYRDDRKELRKVQSRRSHLKRTYGITEDYYVAMEKAQEYRCAICETEYEDKNLHVDHCHESGQVRGLLCLCCNALLGHARDNPVLLDNAINYLKKYKE